MSNKQVMYNDDIEIFNRFLVSENAIVEVLDKMDEKIGLNISKSRKRNLFTTITEIIQNINNYTEKGANHENKCEIGYDKNGTIIIEASNLTNRINMVNLEKKLETLLKLDTKGLEKKYNSSLHNGKNARDRRNGLGIILIIMNAKHIFYKFERITLNLYHFKMQLIF